MLSVFFSSKCSLFHNVNLFGSCIIHILYTGCAKIKKKTRSVYDCTVEDVEYICNSNSTLCFLYCCCYNVSIVTHSRHLVVVMLRCCARRRDGALERLRGDVIDLPYKPPNITRP